MKRIENEVERARRYSEALVTASLKVRHAVEWPGVIGRRPTLPGWCGAPLSFSTGAASAYRRALEA